MNKLLAEHDVDKIDNSKIDVSCLGKRGLHLNSLGTDKLGLNFIKFLKAFCNADFAKKSLGMVHKTLSTLVWRSRGCPLSIPLKENLQQPKSRFKKMNTRVCKFKNTSRFFLHSFDINSGIHSTQQRVKEPEDLKLNPSDQERRYKEQVVNQNKDNTNTNNINGKFEISVIANCINNSFENINNNVMKDTDNMKEITNKNISSNKQIRGNTEKDVRRKEKNIPNLSEKCKNAPFDVILKTI